MIGREFVPCVMLYVAMSQLVLIGSFQLAKQIM